MISTREAFRRRGFGGAMTAALLRAGQAAGASLAVLQASSEGNLYTGGKVLSRAVCLWNMF